MAIMHARPYTAAAFYTLLCLLGASGCTSGVSGSANEQPGAQVPGGGQANPGAGNGPVVSGVGGGTGGSSSAPCTTDDQSQIAFRVLTRLNRAEYDNTARDLLGDTSHAPLTALPPDFGDGAFDNNASALTIDPTLAQELTQVAEVLAQNALAAGSPGRKLLLTCQTTDDACASQIAGKFAARAWRRPLLDGELDRLNTLYKSARTAGFSFDQGVQTLVEATLLSPNFLFRPEIDAALDSVASHAVSAYELATRLSYFMWSSTPDDVLQASAASGELSTPAGMQAQLSRMWASPNAEALFQRFPGQWLHTLDVSLAKVPSPDVYPTFNAGLKAAMEGETAHFMREMMTADVSFLDFIDAKFTYLNAPLAKFYGVSGQFGDDFTRVDLTGNVQRGGVLTQASFLTLTSPPERTSPVMRGQWVLARLLNAAPPAPPNDIPTLESEATTQPRSMRQKMIAHRSNASCAACHSVMDPIGFGLENYDGIGAWRTTDNGIAVDASGDLGSGQVFAGGLQLEQLLKADARVPRAVVQYLVSYALGRELTETDRCMLDATTSAFQSADNQRMKALVSRVVALPVMQMRRGAP